MAYDALFRKTEQYSKKKEALDTEFELFTDEEQKAGEAVLLAKGLDVGVQTALLDVGREFEDRRRDLEEQDDQLDRTREEVSEEVGRELQKLNETKRRLDGLSGKRYAEGASKASEQCREYIDQMEGLLEKLEGSVSGRDGLGTGGDQIRPPGQDALSGPDDHRTDQSGPVLASSFAAHEKTLGTKFVLRMQEKLDQSPHKDVRDIYEKYGSRLSIYKTDHLGGAYYEHGKGVCIHTLTAAVGGLGHKPYQTAFHEFGHNIDYLMGGGEPISEKWGNGALYQALQQDFAELKGDTPDRILVAKLKLEMVKNLRSVSDTLAVSDMLESFTGISYPLGSGHGKKYWKDRLPCKEFFAEVLDGAAANEGSYGLLKQMFPRGVDIVHRIIGGEPG